MSTALPVELDDIQGLVRFGYKHHTEASFLLLRVSDRDAARRWLATVPVCTAETVEPPPETALQIALTGDGMRALGVADAIVDAFAADFVTGMAGDANRARRLGDVGANDPSRWQWGAGARMPHVVVTALCAAGQAGRVPARDRSAVRRRLRADRPCLTTSDLDGIEPFGFMDGISQPLARLAARSARRRTPSAIDVHEPELPRRIPARLSERVRRLHRPAAARRRRRRVAPAARRGRARASRPGPQWQLSGAAPAAPGRARLLAVRRSLRRRQRRRARADRQRDGRPRRRDGVPARRPGRRNDRGRRRPRRPQRLHLSLATRTACAARSARTSGAAIRATPTCRRAGPGSSRGRSGRSASTPRRSTRTWSPRRAFIGCCDAAANTASACPVEQALAEPPASARDRPALHLPGRQHRAPVRIRAERLARWASTSTACRARAIRCSARHLPRADGTPTDGFSMPRDDGPDERVAGLPQFVTVRRRRLLLPARHPRPALPGHHLSKRCRHEFEPEPTGPARQHRLEAARRDLRHDRSR